MSLVHISMLAVAATLLATSAAPASALRLARPQMSAPGQQVEQVVYRRRAEGGFPAALVGGLIGGAALKSADFLSIISAAANAV